MRTWRRARRSILFLVLAFLAAASEFGCSRQLAVPVSAVTPASGSLPFDRASDPSGVSPTAAFASDEIPSGTEIMIQLRTPLSSADARVGDNFAAVLDESLVAAGKTVVARGAALTGSVVASKASAGRRPGYLRMTLSSVVMNGKSLPVQTSSIFAKGRLPEERAATMNDKAHAEHNSGALVQSKVGAATSSPLNRGDVKFPTGHRFTFRLIQPLHPLV